MVSEFEFYNNYCRVCGNTKGICVDLFSDNGKSYLNKVQKLLSIKITKDDALPKNICHVCMSFVSDFDKLRKHCGIVQTMLSNLAGNFCKEKVVVSNSTNGDNIQSSGNIDQSKNIVKSSPSKRTHAADNIPAPIKRNIQPPTDPMIVDLVDVPDSNQTIITNCEKTEPTTAEPLGKDWTVQRLPGKDTTLYICNNCSEMLLNESAMRSHQCQTTSKVTHILPPNQSLPQEVAKRKEDVYCLKEKTETSRSKY